MKIATTTGDFSAYTHDQAEAMRYIYEAGFRYMDYNFGMDYPERTGVYGENWQEYAADLKRQADELGVKFVQSHAPMGRPLTEDPEEYKQFIADNIRCIEACAILGIPSVVVHSGYRVGLTKEETFACNKEFFMPLLEAAERVNVMVLVENFNKMNKENLYWIDNAADLLAQIECVGHPLFQAVWDAGHNNMQEQSQAEGLRILGSRVKAIHVQDNMGDRDSHMVPFTGTMSMDSLMHGLLDIGYEGYFTFEVGNPFLTQDKRRACAEDDRLQKVPLGLRIEAEKLLYQIGKYTLQAYGCFEE